MDVVIRLERMEPPVGTVRRVGGSERPWTEGGEMVPFIGWLGLLRALSEIVGEQVD